MSGQKIIRIIVDTNIWISFVIGRTFDSLINELKSKSVEVYFSQKLLDELLTVLSRPKFQSLQKQIFL